MCPLSLSLSQRVPGPQDGGNLLYDEISNEGGGRTKIMGGGLIVAPPNAKPAVVVEGEGGEGGGEEGGRVQELEKKLVKVMRERERLRQNNLQLQKNLSELQKQV